LDGQFLLQRTEVPVPEAPDSLTMAGVDARTGGYTQRFTGTFSPDENTISGAWEQRWPDAAWEHDFDLTYHRAG
jgi:hypothetical protein